MTAEDTARTRSPSDAAEPSGEHAVPLARDPDFRRLWIGDVGSRLGSEVTIVALPLLAVTSMQATGVQIGLLQAFFMAPFFLLPLAAGLWLDRRTRRPVMLGADLARAALVASIPVAVWLDLASLPQLYTVALLGGALTVLYEVAAQAYLPSLVGTRRLVSANSALNANLAVGSTAGPGVAGWLTTQVGAAATLLLDAVSYLLSAMLLWRIRHREPAPGPAIAEASAAGAVPTQRTRRMLGRELAEGLRSVLANPPVRAIGLHAAIYNGGAELVAVGFIVYFVRDLGLGAWVYGLVLVAGGVGAIIGSLGTPAIVRRIGYGPALLASLSCSTLPYALVPAASDPTEATVLAIVAFFLGSMGTGVGGTVAVTVRQLLTPPELLARMTASYRMLSFGTIPFGALLGGVLVDTVGARDTLWLAPVVLVISGLPVLLSRSVRQLREIEQVGSQAPPTG